MSKPMTKTAREMLHNFALTYRVESKESRNQCLDQALKELEAIHQQEIAKARIEEVKKARDEYRARVPDVFDRDIYQVKYFQYRNEELTAELSQTLKEHKEAEL